MLPTIVFTVASVLINVETSPVYNMQPAYITANIGTTGRNIRNLPCISRKNNQSGVCMFAIDCLKSNGTHLGTCIDRFYFGSCCHVEPLNDVLDNSIEPALFPDNSRDPPARLSTTEKLVDTTTAQPPTTVKTSSTAEVSSSTMSELRQPVKVSTTTASTTITTTTRSTTTTTTTPRPTTTTTVKAETTTRAPVVLTKEPSTTENNDIYKLTTFQSVEGNEIQTTLRPIALFTKPAITVSTNKLKPSPTQAQLVESTTLQPITVSVPLVTRPPSKTTTPKPIIFVKPLTQKPATNKPTSRPSKPKPAQVSTKPTGKPTLRPRPKPTRPTQKVTTKPTNKPIKHTTKPQRKPVSTTKAPISIKPTRRPVINRIPTVSTIVALEHGTTERITTQKLPETTVIKHTTTTTTPVTITTPPTTVKTTQQATTTQSTTTPKVTIADKVELPSSTEQMISSSSHSQINLISEAPVVSSSAQTMKPIDDMSTKTPEVVEVLTDSNDVLNIDWNMTSIAEDPLLHSNGNTSTNEIESVKPIVESTTNPSLVTWTIPDEEPIVVNTTDGDWVPITSPDGWEILPSVFPTTDQAVITAANTTTSASTEDTSSLQPIPTTSDKVQFTITTSEYSNITSTGTTYEEVTTFPSESNGTVSEVTENNLNMSDYTDVCGRRMYPEARIVGGEKSSFGKWPWQISLRQWRTSTYLHKCGAALLSEHWAITAAHCVESVPPSDLLLRLGEYDLATESEPYLHQERRVQIVASHPQFDPRSFEYDLALLRFYEPVKFQPNILPVCVPQTDDDFIGRNAFVTGWGRLYEDGPLPNTLQEVKVPVINNTLCETMYRSAGYIEHIPHIFICAGWRRGGYDSCEGDSGGPMVIQREDKRFLLAGVISWGIGCAEPNQPGVYTRISEFRDWINQILQF